MNATTETNPNPFMPPQAVLEDAKTLADTTFTLNLFSPQGRIGRLRYLAYSWGLTMLIGLVGAGLSALISPFLFAVVYIAIVYVQIMLAIKRSHDFNTTGWLALLVFVPLVGLIFLFVPGTDGPNKFGNKTAPNGGAGTFIVVAVVGVMLIGILAAIAIPAYQQYVQRAKAVQVR